MVADLFATVAVAVALEGALQDLDSSIVQYRKLEPKGGSCHHVTKNVCVVGDLAASRCGASWKLLPHHHVFACSFCLVFAFLGWTRK